MVRTASPSATSDSTARARWAGSGQSGITVNSVAAALVRSTASTAPRHCRSVPSYVCPRRVGPTWSGLPARSHAQSGATGQRSQSRGAGRADHGAEFHRGDRPPAGPGGVRRQELLGERGLGSCGRRRRVGGPQRDPGEHPADVGVQHDVAPAVREAGDRGRGVATDTGQRQQVGVPARHLAVIPLDDLDRRPVQPQGPPRIAEPAPGADRLAGGFGGQRRRCRPAGEPPGPWHDDPGDRGLLKHELADQNPPRAGPRASPGEVSAVHGVPVEHRADHPVGATATDHRATVAARSSG